MYLQHLYPKPYKMESGEGVFSFGTEVIMVTDVGLKTEEKERLQTLFYQFTCTASHLKIQESVLKVQDEVHAILSINGMRDLPQNNRLSRGNHYQISVSVEKVMISAKNVKALIDAFTTMVQLIVPIELREEQELFQIQAVEIEDQTPFDFRGVHICIFPETSPIRVKKAIRVAGFLKFTHVILEFWGTFPYRCLPELAWKNKAYSREEIHELIQEIRSHGMEVIPMINHLGHAAQSRAAWGRHVVLNQAPRYEKLFEPDGWTWCISNPDSYKLLSAMRSEMIEACGSGEYFHLGFDEAASFATCLKCRREPTEEAQFLAEYINRLATDVKKGGRRPIIWGDELIAAKDWPEGVVANGENSHFTAPAVDLLDKDIVIADWQYNLTSGGSPTSEYFLKKGFDVLLCPWNDMENVQNLSNATKQLKAKGMLLTTWDLLANCTPSMLTAATLMWDKTIREGKPWQPPCTEVTAILRRLMTGEEYDYVGVNPQEVEF